MLPAGFKLNGTVVSGKNKVSPQTARITKTLEKLPLKEVFTTRQLATLASASQGGWINDPNLYAYRQKIGGKLFWGNKQTITELKKQLGEPNED